MPLNRAASDYFMIKPGSRKINSKIPRKSRITTHKARTYGRVCTGLNIVY